MNTKEKKEFNVQFLSCKQGHCREQERQLQGVSTAQSWCESRAEREQDGTKRACAYTQKVLCLYAKYLVPIRKKSCAYTQNILCL